MFAVIGHAVAFDGAIPYAAPVALTKEGAVEAFRTFSIGNGEIADEMNRVADALLYVAPGTAVPAYGGDEVLVIQQLAAA